MPADFDFDVDDQDVRAIIDKGIAAVRASVKLTATDLWGNLRREAPVDEGRLAGSFGLQSVDALTWRIASNVQYALFVQEGTGVFGPRGRPIVPVSASVLAFEAGGEMVFTRRVSGMRPDPYVDRAMDRTENRLQEFASLALQEVGA